MSDNRSDNRPLTRSSAFYILAAGAFVSGANLRLFDALLPSVAMDFKVLPATAALAATTFTLSYGIFQILYGPLGDRLGKLRVVAAATLIVAFASFGSAFAPDLPALALLRLLAGIGAAGIIPLALAWIGDNSAYENRQATLGRFVGYLILGQVTGPAIGGLLSQFFGWREVFYGLAAFFFVVSLFLFLEDRKVDRSLLVAAPRNYIREYRNLLSDSWIRIILLTTFLEGALIFGTLAYVGVYLKVRFDISFLLIGAMLACFGIGGFIYSLSVRLLLVRLKETGFITLGGLLLLACFALLPWIPVWQAIAPLLIGAGFGFYLFHNTLQTRATEMAPLVRGTAISLFAFSLFIGQAAGITLNGQLIRFAGYAPAFAVTGVLLFLLTRWFAARVGARDRERGKAG